MGEQIGLKSQFGLGSTFWFQLPLTSTEVEPVVEEEAAAEIDLSQWRVLVVDDVAVNRVVAVRYLQRSGSQVEEAVDGQQALDRFQPGRYDLILVGYRWTVIRPVGRYDRRNRL